MITVADNPDVAAALAGTAKVIKANGGFVSDRFIVREHSGHFSCAVVQGTAQGELLVAYSRRLSTPMHLVDWIDDPATLAPRTVSHTLTVAQRELLEHWLVMMNATEKLRRVREGLPRFVVGSWSLRHHLADAGHSTMRERPGLGELRAIAINWHSGALSLEGVGSPETGNGQGKGLIPLKLLVNHHPEGADQMPVPGKVAVAASAVAGTDETFEYYGDLDSMQLLMGFGFRSDFAPLVHSVPVSVQSEQIPLRVSWLAPRGGRGPKMQDVPLLKAEGEALLLHDLTFRPNNRPRVRSLLAMALRARGASDQLRAERDAEAILDAVAQSNLDYYRRLDELVVAQLRTRTQTSDSESGQLGYESPDLPPLSSGAVARVLEDIAYVSMTQQHKLQSWWG